MPRSTHRAWRARSTTCSPILGASRRWRSLPGRRVVPTRRPVSPTWWNGVPVDDGAEPVLDLSESRTVHVVGAGGAGMSAIATVLAQLGHRVTGSDLRESAPLRRLR